MEQNRWDALQNAGIDLPDALRRMAGNTELLEKFLMRFPEDDNFGILGRALDGADWDTALIAVFRFQQIVLLLKQFPQNGAVGLLVVHQEQGISRLHQTPPFSAPHSAR